ncbi:MAG TPA: hypothetical protein VGH27_25925 [Streptosporangiaceae bacterium]|jgi:hypothetical protein
MTAGKTTSLAGSLGLAAALIPADPAAAASAVAAPAPAEQVLAHGDLLGTTDLGGSGCSGSGCGTFFEFILSTAGPRRASCMCKRLRWRGLTALRLEPGGGHAAG